ncbi:MAG: methyltransferase domain-containing protein [Gemmatimonadaceae bacterium]
MFTPGRDRAEVARIVDLMGLPVGSRVLDVPCGQGRHAHLLAEAGFAVDGLDYSKDLLAIARKRGISSQLRYSAGDMRKLPGKWTGRFDVVINLFTSFGFFMNPLDDALVVREFARALRPGGMLIWHGGSRDGVMARFLARDWWETEDGTIVAHSRSFDPLSGVLTIESVLHSEGKQTGRRVHTIRLYTASRLAELFNASGLIVEEAYDGFTERPLTRRSSEMMLIARKE